MPQSAQPEAVSSAHPTSVQGKKILVIDDGQAVRDIIRIFLEKEGFQICGEAADGEEGVEQAVKLKPDLIVLDLAMPRMNGVEAASVISRTMPAVPIVLLTMYGDTVGSLLASTTGISAVISKTDGFEKLVTCVRSLLQTV
jgi:DNA-binding NarL/FixJ family response regulator